MIRTNLTYIKCMDYTKGGIDIPDQRVGSYTCKVKTKKWKRVVFDICT